jgi:hypothetical protein
VSAPVLKPVNGIYSFFIRAVGVYLSPSDLEKLKMYAVKVVETDDAILYVGRYWVVLVSKTEGEGSETIGVRCFRDVCEPHNDIELYEFYDSGAVIVDVEVKCEEWRKLDSDITDYGCRVVYKYVRHSGIIAVTIDPLDILRVAADDELRLLVELLSSGSVLVRPM